MCEERPFSFSASNGCDTSLYALKIYSVHLHYIVAFLKAPLDHIEQVQRVLGLLYKASATPRLKKCKLLAETNDYFGYISKPGHLELA